MTNDPISDSATNHAASRPRRHTNAPAFRHASARAFRSASAPTFQLGRPTLRIASGLTVALAAVVAGYLLFVPFSDLSARQLAAGAHAAQPGADGAPLPIVLAQTGRSWASDARERTLLAKSPAPAATPPRLAYLDRP